MSELHHLTPDHPAFPSSFAGMSDPPQQLFAMGDLSVLDQPLVSVVGSRRMSTYARAVLDSLIPSLVQSGLAIVSGLAYGVDSQAHRVALAKGGRCVAVLGSGFERIYPAAHHSLFRSIIKEGGLVLSEYPPDASAQKYTFLQRNRLIAGLSHATVIIEAGETSGTLSTARFALDYGRELCVVPSDIFNRENAGVFDLLRTGARPVISAMDILALYQDIPTREAEIPLKPALTGSPATVYSLLSQKPCTLDELKQRTGYSVGQLGSILTILELDGYLATNGITWQKIS